MSLKKKNLQEELADQKVAMKAKLLKAINERGVLLLVALNECQNENNFVYNINRVKTLSSEIQGLAEALKID